MVTSKISINNHKVDHWKADVAASVKFYNEWFLRFAPQTYIAERAEASAKVEDALRTTDDLSAITAQAIKDNPSLLHIFRMLTAPPIALDNTPLGALRSLLLLHDAIHSVASGRRSFLLAGSKRIHGRQLRRSCEAISAGKCRPCPDSSF